MHILWTWCCGKLGTCCLRLLQQLQPLSDRCVPRVQFRRSSIGINGIGDLVVAALVQTPEVEPNLRDIGVDAYSPRVSVQGIPVLVDLEVQNTDRAPESRIAAVAVYGLLIGLVGFVVFLTGHIGTTKKVPTLGVMRV